MAKVSKGRRMFSGAVSRSTINRSSHPKQSSEKHPYGDDYVANAALSKKRDDYRCMAHKVGLPKCSNRFPPPLNHLLHSHHIHPWIKSKNNSVRNLITLCHACHSKTHNKQLGYQATEAQQRFSKKL